MDFLEYQEALEKIALLERYTTLSVKINSFDKSLILSVLFGYDKQKTLQDIMNIRERRG